MHIFCCGIRHSELAVVLREPHPVTLTWPSTCCHHKEQGALGLVKRPGARAVPPPLQWYTGAGEARWQCDCALWWRSLLRLKLCGGCPRDLFENLPHLTLSLSWWLNVYSSFFVCVCVFSGLQFSSERRGVWLVLCTLRLSILPQVPKTLKCGCVWPRLCVMAGTVCSTVQAKCNVHVSF